MSKSPRVNSPALDRYYLFGSDKQLIAGPDFTCEELLSAYGRRGDRGDAKGTDCSKELRSLGNAGPPRGSRIFTVPRGVTVIEADRAPNQPSRVKRYFVLEDDSELTSAEVANPKVGTDEATGEPIVTMDLTDAGRRAFARLTRREAQRGASKLAPPGTPPEQAFQRFAISVDNRIVALATIDFISAPNGIDGRAGVQINGIGSSAETGRVAQILRVGSLPTELNLISKR